MKNKNKFKKIILILFIVIISISCLKFIVKKIEENILEKKEYSSVNDFQTIKEVAKYFECELIKEKISKEEAYEKDIYMELKLDLYDGITSNKGFFENLISVLINVENYNSFRIIDEEKNITIGVICDKKNKTHLKTIINGQENYFLKMDSKNRLEQREDNTNNITQLNVTSPKLKEIINKKWKPSKVDFGKLESKFDEYEIYFSEGIKVKKVDGEIYNIVFTKKYTGTVINNIKVGEENSKIIEKLGEPTFGEEGYIIGYKTNDFYIFFSNNNISVYKVEDYEKEEIINIIRKFDESQNLKELANEITNLWYDYDNYDYDTNFIYLTFSAKGISIEAFNKIENPIKIYNNFKYIDEIKNFSSIEFIDEDLVYIQEQKRLTENLEFPAEDEPERNFALLLEEKGENVYKVRFVSMLEDYPDRELEEIINDYIWYNENSFIYSIDYKGIYIVDLRTGEKKQIVEEKEKIDILNIENSLLQYNEKEIEINEF